jgi:hypothetical protein
MKKHLLIIAFAITTSFLRAQIVNIPDPIFKSALIERGIDKNNDKEIQLDEAKMVKTLSVGGYFISDLTGIEYFTSLDTLICISNNLTFLDVSKNTSLTYLYCIFNKLSTLDVSKNINLKVLGCYGNNLTSLDVSKNTVLELLYCQANSITSLDISKNLGLKLLWCYANNLTELDISKNTALIVCYCGGNPNLPIVCINENQYQLDYWILEPSILSSTCGTITAIEDGLNEPTSKTLIRILTPLGQEIQSEQVTDGLFIYQYSDGSTRKIAK